MNPGKMEHKIKIYAEIGFLKVEIDKLISQKKEAYSKYLSATDKTIASLALEEHRRICSEIRATSEKLISAEQSTQLNLFLIC